MKSRTEKKVKSYFVIVLNLVIVVAILLLFFDYIKTYNQKLYDQNLRDIGNVNQAAAQISSELSASHERKINNILLYASVHKMTQQDFMTYVNDCNSDSGATFQLIGADYSGYVLQHDTKGEFPHVSYSSNDYQKIKQYIDALDNRDGAQLLTWEFTDQYTGSRCFGRCTRVTLWDGETPVNYALLLTFKSSDFTEHIALNGGFSGMSTVLINSDGSYVLRNANYKSDNFFQYLYVYNNLSLDEIESVKTQVYSADHSTFRYLNSIGEDCAFVCSPVPGTDWTCVSSVPISDFHSSNPDYLFSGVLILLLACLLVTDILYLNRMNHRLKQSAREAMSANEAKTDFLSRMSHDIRTPINVISGMTSLALLENNPPSTEEYLKNIQSSGKFLLGLVNDILDMNKVESGNMELHPRAYSHQEFITYINAVIRPLCEEKEIDFQIHGNIENLTVYADPLRINQIFFNLLSNAVKFTPKGGHISVDGHVTPINDGRVSLDFAVKDDGVGMSEEFQKSMFTAFSQEARTAQINTAGTGLGLAIVKKLVDLMNGTIRVESSEGKGSTFFIHLELSVAEETRVSKAQEHVTANLAGKKILLCEDHPLNAKIVVKLLALKNVEVDVAENGKIGVEKFEQSSENFFDAILMDVRMPVMNGIDASRAIRAMSNRKDAASIPIIALTANAYDSDVQGCLNAGMNAHLAKPVDPEKLYEALSEYL